MKTSFIFLSFFLFENDSCWASEVEKYFFFSLFLMNGWSRALVKRVGVEFYIFISSSSSFAYKWMFLTAKNLPPSFFSHKNSEIRDSFGNLKNFKRYTQRNEQNQNGTWKLNDIHSEQLTISSNPQAKEVLSHHRRRFAGERDMYAKGGCMK